MHLPTKVIGQQQETDGLTENISAAGVYLLIDGGMEVGASAEFEITVPGETVGTEGDVRLRCTGRVVRCDQEAQPGRSGIACVIEKYEILRAGQAPEGESVDGGE